MLDQDKLIELGKFLSVNFKPFHFIFICIPDDGTPSNYVSNIPRNESIEALQTFLNFLKKDGLND